MRYAFRKAKEGFTLIELMIVVAIVGVLAVLAIYGVKKYIANSKTAEARNMLGQVAKDSATHYEKESMSGAVLAQGNSTAVTRSLCQTSSSVPGAITSVQGKKYQSNPTEWNGNLGWACLKFSVDQPQYYMYSYSSTGTAGALNDTFTATANGDLNGDGIQSTFTVAGDIGAGFVLNVSPNITETNPEE